ncbi:hypothetical protein ACXJJ3_10790 [Kribbella sp. WER1]
MTRVGHRRKKKRSRSAISAGIVAGLALAAVFAVILTRGTTTDPTADGLGIGSGMGAGMGSGTDDGAAAPTASASGSVTKADRRPPVSQTKPTAKAQTTTLPPVNTGPESPKFMHGQWIAVLDKYPAEAGDTAKATATKVTRSGIPAKAMLVNGQYRGLTDSSLAPITGTWVVYLGPGTSSEQMLNLCQDPRTQAAYPGPCPTYEPAG